MIHKTLLKLVFMLGLPAYVFGRSQNHGSSAILSFTHEIRVSSTAQWTNSAILPRGTETRLKCLTEATSPTKFTIRLFDSMSPLTTSEHSGLQTLTYELGHIDCDKMGTYICESEEQATRIYDLGIYNCEPRLCDHESQDRTIFARERETSSFSLCVVAFPEISSVTSTKNETPSVGTNWNWTIEARTFNIFTLHFTLSEIFLLDYGVYTFTVFSADRGKRLHYRAVLKETGPPDCPADIEITSQGPDYVTLTWRPGLDGGATQSFLVYFSTEDNKWESFKEKTQDSVMTVTGLEEDTHYMFRVVSLNEFTEHSLENRCPNTVETRTDRLVTTTRGVLGVQVSEPSKAAADDETALIIVLVTVFLTWIVLAIGTVISVKIGKLLMARLRKRQQNRTQNGPNPRAEIRDQENRLIAQGNQL